MNQKLRGCASAGPLGGSDTPASWRHADLWLALLSFPPRPRPKVDHQDPNERALPSRLGTAVSGPLLILFLLMIRMEAQMAH